MICWSINKKVEIFFSRIPYIAVRFYTPNMNEAEKKSIEKKPFICENELKVCLKDLRKHVQYEFLIPSRYCFDGASIPRFFWRIIGPNTDNKFLIPALIHDMLCEHHNVINSDKSFSTEVFNALLETSGISCIKRFCMKNSVAFYQTLFCKW